MTKLGDIIAALVGKPVRKLQPRDEIGSRAPGTGPREERREFPVGPEERSETEAHLIVPKDTEASEIVLTEEFNKAFQKISERPPFTFITGRAGTGKSTFTKLLKERLRSYAVVAPTGVAALNVGGQTIHSFFRLAPGPIDFEKIRTVKNRIAYKALSTLIIDEISMVRADVLDAIDRFLRVNGPREGEPFGGVQVIAIGDLFQLPPVIATAEESALMSRGYSSPFFFGAAALKGVQIQVIEFTRVFRQTEESFISILNNVREGRNLDETLARLDSRVLESVSVDFAGIVLTGTNAAASRTNAARLAEIPAPPTFYRGEVTGDLRIEQSRLPAPFELELKRGAQVMFLKNDKAKCWVNGSLGIVTECTPDSVLVSMNDHNGPREVRVAREKWENFKYEYNVEKNAVVAIEIGAYHQIPLTPAWAITIHKSQGKTFERVHIDLENGAFAEGQLYVALSRCRTLEGITLSRRLTRDDVILNYDVVQFAVSQKEGS